MQDPGKKDLSSYIIYIYMKKINIYIFIYYIQRLNKTEYINATTFLWGIRVFYGNHSLFQREAQRIKERYSNYILSLCWEQFNLINLIKQGKLLLSFPKHKRQIFLKYEKWFWPRIEEKGNVTTSCTVFSYFLRYCSEVVGNHILNHIGISAIFMCEELFRNLLLFEN